jgi:RND family efflux transporter MFP subunit
MKKIIAIIIAVILVVLAGFKLMHNREKNVAKISDTSLKEVLVTVADVKEQNASFNLEFTGTLNPVKQLDIPAETSGKITSLKFDLGSTFARGGVIATIDDKIKKLAYETAKLDAEKQKRDYERIKNLFDGGTSSKQELDNALTSYETAKNKADDAEKQLSYTKIATSIAGTIVKKNVEEGTYVNAGTVIATIVDISRLKIRVNVSENNVYYLKKGNKVKITTDIYPGAELSGAISFISPAGDDAHNYIVEIEIPNSAKYPLKAGTFVNVAINISSERNGLFIPRGALMGSVKDAKVYLVENGRARLRPVTIGNKSGDYLEVIGGLSKDQKVVISGQVNLTDNKPIKIINNN